MTEKPSENKIEQQAMTAILGVRAYKWETKTGGKKRFKRQRKNSTIWRE